jgi:apolipoprotein N-acyltransferase
MSADPTPASPAVTDETPPLVDEPETPTDPTPSGRERVLAFTRRPFVRAVVAGLLLAASTPPWGWWPLGMLGMAVFDRVLADAPWRSRLARGAVTGIVLFVPTILWITQLTFPGYVVAVLILGAFIGVFAALVPPGRGRRPALVGAWVLCESLRSAWPFGGIPLSLLAVGQVGGPLAGLARVGGVLLLGGATVAIGVGISAAAERRWQPAAIAIVGVLAVLAVADGLAPRGADTGRTVNIAFVQGGGEQGTRAIDSDPEVVFERHLDASEKYVPAGMDLVLWPENVVDSYRNIQNSTDGDELLALARRLDAPVLVGTVEGVNKIHFRNSQQVVLPDGTWGDRYVKVQRVPFGEWVPFRSLIEKVAPNTLAPRDATISHQSGLLHTPKAPVATVISWEVFFGHRARSAVRAGGELLYNPTNGSTYTGTFVQTQQIASSRLRAIETGRWEVQVAPTGFSAYVSPNGVVHQRTGTREQSVQVRRDVPLRDGWTWYVRWGDLPPRAAAVLLLAAGWALALRRRGSEDEVAPAPAGDGTAATETV